MNDEQMNDTTKEPTRLATEGNAGKGPDKAKPPRGPFVESPKPIKELTEILGDLVEKVEMADSLRVVLQIRVRNLLARL